ncbi:MAG: hypothetical protein LBK98_01810, partial [Peptococcaceae bacterium]|nr:hypothetical protein [Peptococcaceae bacterium]
MADLLYYGSSFGSGFGSGFLSGLRDILLAAVGVLIISIILAIVLYIFQALSLYTMAERRGLPNPWLAWIPIASIYTLGSVTDDINRRGGKNTVYRWLLLAGNILVFMPVFINLTFVRV